MTELLRKHRRYHDQHAPPRIAGSPRAASYNRGTLSIPRSVSQEQRLAIHGEATVWQHRDHGYVVLVSRASLRRFSAAAALAAAKDEKGLLWELKACERLQKEMNEL